MHYMDNISTLERIKQLANAERGEFQIIPSDAFSGYYAICIGKHSYVVQRFDEELLFNALVALSARIAVDEKWFNNF